jgi:hypothetical protein
VQTVPRAHRYSGGSLIETREAVKSFATAGTFREPAVFECEMRGSGLLLALADATLGRVC